MEIKLKHIFLANAIVSLLFGLGFLIIPEFLLPLLGISGQVLGFRVYSTSILGNSILTFFARNSEESSARKAILLQEIIAFLILNILMFIYLDLTNLMVWFTIILHFIFVGAYAYFLLKK